MDYCLSPDLYEGRGPSPHIYEPLRARLHAR